MSFHYLDCCERCEDLPVEIYALSRTPTEVVTWQVCTLCRSFWMYDDPNVFTNRSDFETAMLKESL